MAILDKIFTAEGSPNIALIKYWGKRDEKRILPQNSSISLTLSSSVLKTTTSVVLSKNLKHDIFYLDGVKQDLSGKDIQERFSVVDILRRKADSNEKALIVSNNDFPTASGMASSASGIATLVYVMDKALGLNLPEKELSIVARQGSGSACRSMFGGLVAWRKGTSPSGGDSYAEQIFDENYWPELIDNIVVVSQERKKVPSRAGMLQTVKTNPLYGSRPASAEKRFQKMINAYRRRDFDEVAGLMMADSNEMHALMMSTIPPIRYLNKSSYAIMDAVDELNHSEGRNIAGYTFDAGANSNVITLKKYKAKVLRALSPMLESKEILYIKTSMIGHGPKMLGESSSLIDLKRMRPF